MTALQHESGRAPSTIAGKRMALFGVAFKANTGDTRESPALAVAANLLAGHAHVVITDPKAIPTARGAR